MHKRLSLITVETKLKASLRLFVHTVIIYKIKMYLSHIYYFVNAAANVCFVFIFWCCVLVSVFVSVILHLVFISVETFYFLIFEIILQFFCLYWCCMI